MDWVAVFIKIVIFSSTIIIAYLLVNLFEKDRKNAYKQGYERGKKDGKRQ